MDVKRLKQTGCPLNISDLKVSRLDVIFMQHSLLKIIIYSSRGKRLYERAPE